MNINEAVKRLAGFLNIRQLGERICSDLVDTWWIIALSLSGNASSPIASLSYQPKVVVSSPSSGS